MKKMFKAYKFTGTDVHYHWICLFSLFAPVLVIDYLMSFSSLSVQHLAFTEASTLLCQFALQSSVPICWKQSTQHILWQPLISSHLSQHPCFFLPVTTQRQGLFLPKRPFPCNPCLPTTQIQHGTHAQERFIPLQSRLMLNFSMTVTKLTVHDSKLRKARDMAIIL